MLIFNKFRLHHFLLLALIIAAFLRLYNIAGLPPGLYPDEAMNGNNALESLAAAEPAGGFKMFYPENNGREGLFINIQALSVAIFGNEPWALRSVSALFGIFTVLGVYFLTKELFSGHSIALLSAFFLAASFWHINFSRIGFRAIMAPFFLTWGIYFLLKSFNSIILPARVIAGEARQARDIKRCALYAVAGGIFYGLGFHSYIAYRGTPLLIFIILVLHWLKNRDWESRKKILFSVLVFSLLVLIVFAPLGFYFLQNPRDFFGRTAQVSVFSSPAPLKNLTVNVLKTAGMFNFFGDYNWRHNYAGKPLLFWPVGILFLIGVAAAVKNIFNSRFIILFSWLAIAALPVVISNEGIPHALRAILMVPPVFILAGYGGILFYEKLNEKFRNPNMLKIFEISAVLFLGIVAIQGYVSYFILWGGNPNVQGAFAADYVKIGRELSALPLELPKYVIVEAGGADVRGIPMPSQTVMFITDTFTPEKQKEKNIFYILPDQAGDIPAGAYSVILR